LSHYAGLAAWIPFIKLLDDNSKPSEKYYRKNKRRIFHKVADSLFLRNDYQDTIMKIIAETPLALKKIPLQ
jgi:hypothetical protein